MITVKFFGLVRIEANKSQLLVKAGTIRQVLNEVRQSCPSLSEQQLKQAVMFVNKQQMNGNRRFSVELKDGDELVLLSPMCGG